MANKKKYSNNVDKGTRHHYDVYELIGEQAYHIAPFTTEFEAERVARSLAALDVLEEGIDHSDTKYVVRGRPTVAHNIHRLDARLVKRQTDSMNQSRRGLMKLLSELKETPKEEIGSVEIKPKKKRIIKKKDRVA